MTTSNALSIGVMGLATLAGCFRPEPPSPAELDRGLVVMLPGVEGGAWQLEGPIRGLRTAGLNRAIEVIEWGRRPLASLDNLTNLPANLQRAQRIAGRIGEYQQQYPGRPVTLLGYSGGGGVAVLAAEALPAEPQLDRVVLIAAAISPDHDLSETFRRSRRGVVSFYSERDVVMLGLGTCLFGTIDRQYTSSAGRIGFRDDSGGLLTIDGPEQIAWRPDWWRLGHDGTHVGWLSAEWSREVLAGYIDPRLTKR